MTLLFKRENCVGVTMGMRHPGLVERAQLKSLRIAAEPEPRPHRRGEKSQARRIEAGFRILAGEGVYSDADFADDEDTD